MAHLLGAEAIHLEYPTQVVFESVSLGVDDGGRIGIVGRNGDGKSSLLKLPTGQLRPDSGRVTRRGGLRVSALSQGDTLEPDRTVGWTLVGEAPEHQWAGDARVRDVVGGLVADIAWDATVATLSGGQRRGGRGRRRRVRGGHRRADARQIRRRRSHKLWDRHHIRHR